MSADRLREAAALLRVRAEAATPGPWDFRDCEGEISVDAGTARTQWKTTESGFRYGTRPSSYISSDRIVEHDDLEDWDRGVSVTDDQRRDDLAFIATMHPPVALALADWLDGMARSVHGTSKGDVPHEDAALHVADLILGKGDR